jgi:uncharacterized protein (TIGR00730 family)
MKENEISKQKESLTIDDIKNGCITIGGDDAQETKLCMIREEFRNGIDRIKECNPSVTFYGSTRMKEDHPWYKKTRDLAYRISKELGFAIVTGGGGGIMEAANKGAYEADGKSWGLTIRLPLEQETNRYVKEEIPFEFFFARRVTMSYATEVCIFCPGGFGTFDELFEILTSLQTEKIDTIPIILYGSEFWTPLEKYMKENLLDKYNTIDNDDLKLYTIEDDDDKILEIVKNSKLRNGEYFLK